VRSDAQREFQDAARRFVEDSIRAVETANRSARQHAEAAARQAEEQLRTQRRTNARDQFVKKYGVQAFVSMRVLAANPFNFEGKVVGVIVSFNEMLTPTTGVLGGGLLEPQVLVSQIPRGTFKGGETVILAGRIIGKSPVKTPGGEVSLSHLKFVGMQLCDADCFVWASGR